MYNYRDLFDRELPNEFFNMNMNNGNSVSLYTPIEGYNKGNLFSNLYSTYKNYNPKNLEGKDNKSRLWLEMNRVLFSLHELNLYLDVNPNNTSMIQLFSDYRKKANDLINEYEKNYGPLTTLSDVSSSTTFNWMENDFPWEGGSN